VNRSVKCDCSTISAENEFVVELRQSDVILFVLELSMLMMGLIKQLNVLFDSGNSLHFSLDENLVAGDRAAVKQKDKRLSITLSANQLEYICASLFRVYRDQIAEVNHLHIEGIKNSEGYDLTLMFESVSEPLTPEEAAKLMGD